MTEKKIHQTHFQVSEMPWKKEGEEDSRDRIRAFEGIVSRFGISVGEIILRTKELREKSKRK